MDQDWHPTFSLHSVTKQAHSAVTKSNQIYFKIHKQLIYTQE